MLLDVSASMWELCNCNSDVTLAFNSIKNIIWLLSDFVKINVIIFWDMFYKFTEKEFSRFKKPEDLENFIYKLYISSTYNKKTNMLWINVKKNKNLINTKLTNNASNLDITCSTYEYLAFQAAVDTLKYFNGKTGIISLCDWESRDFHNNRNTILKSKKTSYMKYKYRYMNKY